MTHRSLVRSYEPSLKKRCNSMYARHQVRSRSFCFGNLGNLALVSFLFQTCISLPAVGMDSTPGFNRVDDEPMEAVGFGIFHRLHSDPSNALAGFLRSNDYQRFATQSSAMSAAFRCSPIRFVDLDASCELIAPRPHHSPPQFVQHHPGGPIASQPKDPLQSQCTYSALLPCHPPRCSKPDAQRQVAAMKHRPRCRGSLVPAAAAFKQHLSYQPCTIALASRTTKSVRPTSTNQVLSAQILFAKKLIKLSWCPRIIHTRHILHVGGA